MTIPWYSLVEKGASLDQGELIKDCPVITWSVDTLDSSKSDIPSNKLKEAVKIETLDVVVMTQTCDLAQKKVDKIILCPHYSLDTFRETWESSEKEKGKSIKNDRFKGWLNKIVAGQFWYYSMLNMEEGDNYKQEHRIVDFHEVFSLPRDFLESYVKDREDRIKLLPPYREHLSQAFARFFMRVGLPTDINKIWK